MIYYILDDKKNAVPCSLPEWSSWFQSTFDERIVKQEYVGEQKISTVFLGMDHSWSTDEILIFETLIMGGEHDNDMWRYSTWEQAERNHKDIVELLENNRSLDGYEVVK